ncbi:YihY/virulence factor BrkB family protein [Pararhodobacter zhoushanensis]|uniref:YihY/virulence factor BrkB family protein n=1 Tax=Pararhodobacter zhoushanensis TaxID=2479545 RepID=UPI000F8E5368|nr:YihY/virulence factor BrkB family protein [Pararhodobacter zhoushanensis]
MTDSPIPARRSSLRGFAMRLYVGIGEDQIGLLAAGIAFYALLAIFPALASIMAILGIFFDSAEITGPLAEATASMPPSAAQLIMDQASGVTGSDSSSLGLAAGIGILVALYSTARGMRHLIQGLNVAFNRVEARSFLLRWFTIVILSMFVVGGVILGLGAIAVIPVLLKWLPLDVATQASIGFARWVALFALSTGGIAMIYRFGPSRRHHQWQWIWPGAVVACLMWVIASAGFSIYAENFASYQESFGALAGVIVLLTWLWLSAYVLLLGAELNAALEDSTHPADAAELSSTAAPVGPKETIPTD